MGESLEMQNIRVYLQTIHFSIVMVDHLFYQ
jgi:hypothetical protein